MNFTRESRWFDRFDTLAEIFADVKIVCSDGVLLWNRSALAASSSFLRTVLSEDDSFLILDSFSVASLRKCRTAGYAEYDVDLDEDDECLLDLLQIDIAHIKTEDDERESVPANQIAYMQEFSDNCD